MYFSGNSQPHCFEHGSNCEEPGRNARAGAYVQKRMGPCDLWSSSSLYGPLGRQVKECAMRRFLPIAAIAYGWFGTRSLLLIE